MNYGAFTDYNETSDLLEINGQQNNSELPSEMRLRRFTEPLFGAFRRDKKYLYGSWCSNWNRRRFKSIEYRKTALPQSHYHV